MCTCVRAQPEELTRALCVIDMSSKFGPGASNKLAMADVKAWEAEHGQVALGGQSLPLHFRGPMALPQAQSKRLEARGVTCTALDWESTHSSAAPPSRSCVLLRLAACSNPPLHSQVIEQRPPHVYACC